MKVKAIKSFVGVVSMSVGDIKDIQSDEVVNDLVKAGYVEAVEDKPEDKPKAKTESKPKAKPEAKKPKAKKDSTTKKSTKTKK